MKVQELDNILNEILEDEAKKIIMEQMDEPSDEDKPNSKMLGSIKGFPSLSGLIDKIDEIEDAGSDGFVPYISIKNVTPEKLIDCCGGTSLSNAQTKLMQGIHHDLEDNGFGGDFDVDVDTQGDENALHIIIRITPNNDKTLTDMSEEKDKKEILLGSKKSCTECGKELSEDNTTGKCNECSNEMLENKQDTNEQWQELAIAMAPTIANAVVDKLTGGDKEEVDEDKKKDKKWIQKAVNPKHKGYCTPMTKPTCTGKRKALAKTFHKIAKQKNESMKKKTITLNEDQMAELIRKALIEGVPGIDVTKRVTKEAGEQNKEALKKVEDIIRKYVTYKGSKKVDFPTQSGKGEEKKARVNTKEQDEIVSLNRGQGIGEADYDYEPSKEFTERQKEAIEGSSRMGNPPDAANAIKTDVNKNVTKSIKARKEAKEQEPIYAKEAVPVNTKKEQKNRSVNEEVEKEIEKMKRMSSYNEKTQ